MKKNINKILGITALSLLLVAIVCYISAKINDPILIKGLESSNTLIADGDPLKATAGIFGIFGSVMILFVWYGFLLIIPIIAFLSTLAIQSIARLFQIGEPKKWKDTTSKVLIWISIAVLIILSIYMISFAIQVKVYTHIIPAMIVIGTIYLIIKNLFEKK